MGFISALKAKGYDPEKLKKLFESDDLETSSDPKKVKAKELMERHRALVRDGIDESYRNAHFYWAIDKSFDAGQQQITPTVMRTLMGKKATDPGVIDTIKQWGLERIIVDGKEDASGAKAKVLDLPVFFDVLVPLVTSYLKARQAKLWSMRNTVPLYKYSPASPTTTNHSVCEVITNEIARDAENMGYRSLERDVILHTLMYGFAWSFPREDYFIQKSLWSETEKGTPEEFVSRQGIRWDLIHPTKVFWDRTCPANSINTDTGVSWMGYWSVIPYRNIDNDQFWNKDKIVVSNRSNSSWARPDGWRVYNELYPCALKFPSAWGAEGNDNQRDDKWYTRQLADNALQLVTLFEKLKPKDHGLYDCEIEVWHRFMYAGDGTLIGCVPFAFTPGTVNLYDSDPNRSRNTSLALELVPFQDHIGNLLSQYLLSVRQNLINCCFFNAEQVNPDSIMLLKQLSAEKLATTNFIPFKKHQLSQMGTNVDQAFHVPNFPRHDVSGLVQAINTFISAMERMLGFSPQEVGAAASHEQSATEVAVIDGGTSARLDLTSSYCDDGYMARQRIAYEAWYEYGTKQIDQEMGGLTEVQIDALKKVGFKVEIVPNSKLVTITGKRNLADVDSFIQYRSPKDRFNDGKVAIAMIQALQMIMGNPELVQTYGVNFLMQRFNQILEYSGVPGDWRFNMDTAQSNSGGITAQMQQMLQQNNAQISQELQKGIIDPIGQKLQSLEQGAAQSAQAMQQIAGNQGEMGKGLQAQGQTLDQLMAQTQQLISKAVAEATPPGGMIPPPPQDAPVDPGIVMQALQKAALSAGGNPVQ